MKKLMFIKKLPVWVALLTTISIQSMAQDPKAIIQRMEENFRGDASYNEMSMETVRPRFTRETTMKAWSLGDDFSLVVVTAPARDAGNSFLKRGNEIWNYLPNIDRTVKLPPSMMSQSWMGSDFSNDDLVQGSSTVDDYNHRFIEKEIIDRVETYKIELKPLPDTPIVYDKIYYWISTGSYLPVKVENYDEFGDLVSTINFREVKNMGGRNIPTVMEMIPHGRIGHKTIIRTHKADFNIQLSESFFTQQNMRNVR